jgi:myo-inositol-1(or 4)-monophosphatase
MTERDLQKLASEVEPVVRAAGKLAMALQPNLQVRRKDDGSPVTNADIAVEELLFDRLCSLAPGSVFMGEERPVPQIGEQDLVWVVDPIDGTDSYRHGLAYFGVSVGLAKGCEFLLGVFHNPFLDEMYVAWRGGGAWRNGQRLSVMQAEGLPPGCFACGPSNAHRKYDFALKVKMRSLGSTAQHLALVADGRSCFAFCSARLWDVAAGTLLVDEAGGIVAHLDGEPFCPEQHFQGNAILPALIAGHPNIVSSLVGKIKWRD